MSRVFTSREFNQDIALAKREAQRGPVTITSRGRRSHVLLSAEEYDALASPKRSLGDLLAMKGGDDIEFEPPRLNLVLRPVDLDD